MKKLLLFLIAISITFSAGCKLKESTGRQSGYSDEIVVYNGVKNPDAAQASEYLSYLESEKGIKLVPEIWDSTVPIQDLDGLLKIDLDEYRRLFENRHDLLLPLNDILAANSHTNDIPDSIMNTTTDDDGKIWGFLISHNIDFYARVYNDLLMEQLDMDVPGTPEELKAFLIAAKEMSNLDAMQVVQEFCAEAFYDVFSYYRCPVIDGRYTIGWSENEKSFVDCAYSDEMIQSLSFIKELRDSGLISCTTGTYYVTETAINEGKTITAVLERGLVSESRKVSSAFDGSVVKLEYGGKEVQFFEEVEYHSIYVLPINTSDPEARVHDFINTFYGDERINKSAEYGIEGKHFEYSGTDYISPVDFKSYYNPRLAGWWLGNHYIWMPYHSTEEYIEYYTDNVWEEVKANFYNGIYDISPIARTISYNDRHIRKLEIHEMFNNLLYKFVLEEMEVQEFLDEYRKMMKSLGAEEYISVLNSGT